MSLAVIIPLICPVFNCWYLVDTVVPSTKQILSNSSVTDPVNVIIVPSEISKSGKIAMNTKYCLFNSALNLSKYSSFDYLENDSHTNGKEILVTQCRIL